MDLNFKIESTEKDCAILGNYFHNVVTDMKATAPVWEDFVNKGTKLHGLLKTTSVAISAFLDSLQKIADVVTQSKGTTKDLGSILTRLCVRQKMMEAKLRQFTSIMLERLLLPMQDKLDEWKKSSAQLEKDHAKEYKKATNEIRKKSNDTLRLQKKFRKGSKSDVHYQLSTMMQDVNDKFILLGEGEKSAVKNLLVEERSRVCFLSSCLGPVLEVEVSMLNEVSHLQDLLTDLSRLTKEPKQLPNNTEQLLTDLVNGNQDLSNPSITASASSGHLSQSHGISPPSSPNTTDSRKSSMCSLNSSDSRSSSSQSHNSGSFSFHNKSTNHMPPTVSRLMSISSHDSGFSSTITNESSNGRSKPASPTHQSKLYHQHSMGEIGSEATSPVIKSTRSMSTPGESPPKLHMNKNNYQHTNSYQASYNGHDINPLPSKPILSSAKPINVANKTGSEQDNKYGVCDPSFFTPPAYAPLDNSPPPIEAWAMEDLPPPPPELLENTNQEMPLPQIPDHVEDQRNTMTEVLHNNAHDINKLQDNFTKSSSISNSSHHNQSVALGSRSSLSSGDFLATMTLGRKNSNNSLQYSSGYSSQHSTPACSEDTIASHDTDYGSMDGEEPHLHDNMREFERWSTLPRQRHQPQKSTQRSQRPASTAGFPNGPTGPTIINTSGTATIKRKPSSKFSSVGRRTNAPMPVAPPTAPPITPSAAPQNHYTANQNRPYLKRHQSEGMFVGVNSHYYYNNNNTAHHNGFTKSNSPNNEDFAPPLPPRDNSR